MLHDLFADAGGVTPLKRARFSELARLQASAAREEATFCGADACVHDRQENERRTCRVPGG